MPTRRDFLRLSALATAVGFSLPTAHAAAPKLLYGVQLYTMRKEQAADNPWGVGATTLEWTLSSPPPFHQFEVLPRVQ